MNLDDPQRKKVAEWIAEGLKLSDIQSRLASDFGLRLTYMEVRLLVDDLKLTPKDAEPAKPADTLLQPPAGAPPTRPGPKPPPGQRPQPKPAGGGVSVTVDELTRPGSVASGKVTFSDGQVADWYIDQAGRLAMATQQRGYRPSATDLQQFQGALDAELQRMGF